MAWLCCVALALALGACSSGTEASTDGSGEKGGSETVAVEVPATTEEPVDDAAAEEDTTAEDVTDIARPSTAGSLQVIGTQLCDEEGNAIQLRGISLHGLAWYGQYVNEEAFQTLAGWGCNVVRLPLYTAEYGGWCTDGDHDELLALLDKGVEAAAACDMYVIVDWHVLQDQDPNVNIDEAIAFFDEASARYAGYGNVIYEICNEPNGSVTWADVKSYAEEVIPHIRANDVDALIIVGTPTWSQDVDAAAADPIEDQQNIMYALHFYAATHKDDLRAKLVAAHEAGLPVIVSEFGICDASGSGAIDEESAQEWIDLLDGYDMSYLMWNLSNKDESSSILLPGCAKTGGFGEDDLSEAGWWIYELLRGEKTDQASEPVAQEETPASVAASGGIEASVELTNSWSQDGATCYQYAVVITNPQGAAVNGWSVQVSFDGEPTLRDSWNGTFEIDGSVMTITSADYNASIGAEGSLTDVGFIVSGARATGTL